MKKLMAIAALAALASSLAMAPARAAETEKVFKFYCAQCHGLGGKGDGPNVISPMPRRWTSSPTRT
jgi:mono/diheme cytochrome c family protein